MARNTTDNGSAVVLDRPTDVAVIPLNRIRPGTNVRDNLQVITELAKSIRQHGVLTAVLVTRRDDGDYDLDAGYWRIVQTAGVDAVAVLGQGQALAQVRAGLVVGGVERLEPGGHQVELVGEAVLFLFEQVEGQRGGVVGLEAGAALVLDAVALDGELRAFGLGGGVQGGELLIEHPEHGVAHVGGIWIVL